MTNHTENERSVEEAYVRERALEVFTPEGVDILVRRPEFAAPQRHTSPARRRDPVIVHIAGLDVRVGHRLRQRCVASTSTGGAFPSWPVGALVARDGAVTHVLDHTDGDDVPPECCCASIDPEVTA